MAGSHNVDTTWAYETDTQSYLNYIAEHIMDLVHAILMLAALVCAQLCFSFFV